MIKPLHPIINKWEIDTEKHKPFKILKKSSEFGRLNESIDPGLNTTGTMVSINSNEFEIEDMNESLYSKFF